VDLVVARDDVALGIDEERAVRRLSGNSLIANEPTWRKMPSLRASSRKAASVASFSSGAIAANRRSRLTSKMLVISGVST